MDDPEARAQWLAGIRPRPVIGPFADVLDRLQVFTIFTSIWIRAIGALLAASLIACTVQRIPGTWRTVAKPHVNVGPAFFEHAPQHEAMTFHRLARRDPRDDPGGLQAPPLPDAHRGRRHGPPLLRPQPLGAVVRPRRPRRRGRDPGRRDGRLDVRLPRRPVHADRGLHVRHPEGRGRDDHPQLLQGHLQPHDGPAARLRERHLRDAGRQGGRPPAGPGQRAAALRRASPSTRPSSGRPRS